FGASQALICGGIGPAPTMDLGDLPPDIRLDRYARLELNGGLQLFERGFVLGQDLERGAQRRKNTRSDLPIVNRVPQTTQRVLVIVNRLAVQVQNARTIARGAQVLNCALTIVAPSEVQR